MQETWVRSLSREDPLEKEMATHSSILAWRIPWTEDPGGLQSMGYPQGRKESDMTERLHFHFPLLKGHLPSEPDFSLSFPLPTHQTSFPPLVTWFLLFSFHSHSEVSMDPSGVLTKGI